MNIITKKEEILRKNNWTTKYSRLFFKHNKKNIEKNFHVYGSGIASHAFIKKKNENGLFCFGFNDFYQLGLGNKETITSLKLVEFFTDMNIVKISCGIAHSLFLVGGNRLYTAGINILIFDLVFKDQDTSFRILKKPSLTPIIYENKKIEILDVESGAYHAMVLSKSLEVYSFGKNAEGQLGLGDTNMRKVASKINLPEKIISISCGAHFAYFISTLGNVYVCGENTDGQLSIPNIEIQSTPLKLSFFKEKQVLQISCGVCQSYFINSDYQVFSTPQVGINIDAMDHVNMRIVGKIDPVPSLEKEKIMFVKCGAEHHVFFSKNKIWMCGWNEYGQVCTSDFENVLIPTLFSQYPLKRVVFILMMLRSSIFFSENEVYGSGCNLNGELFCGKVCEKNPCPFKICDLELKKRKEQPKEIFERFEFLITIENKKIELLV